MKREQFYEMHDMSINNTAGPKIKIEDGQQHEMPSLTEDTKKITKKRRVVVKELAKKACFHCKKGHRKCDNERPCNNCKKSKKECFDVEVERKKKSGPVVNPKAEDLNNYQIPEEIMQDVLMEGKIRKENEMLRKENEELRREIELLKKSRMIETSPIHNTNLQSNNQIINSTVYNLIPNDSSIDSLRNPNLTRGRFQSIENNLPQQMPKFWPQHLPSSQEKMIRHNYELQHLNNNKIINERDEKKDNLLQTTEDECFIQSYRMLLDNNFNNNFYQGNGNNHNEFKFSANENNNVYINNNNNNGFDNRNMNDYTSNFLQQDKQDQQHDDNNMCNYCFVNNLDCNNHDDPPKTSILGQMDQYSTYSDILNETNVQSISSLESVNKPMIVDPLEYFTDHKYFPTPFLPSNGKKAGTSYMICNFIQTNSSKNYHPQYMTIVKASEIISMTLGYNNPIDLNKKSFGSLHANIKLQKMESISEKVVSRIASTQMINIRVRDYFTSKSGNTFEFIFNVAVFNGHNDFPAFCFIYTTNCQQLDTTYYDESGYLMVEPSVEIISDDPFF